MAESLAGSSKGSLCTEAAAGGPSTVTGSKANVTAPSFFWENELLSNHQNQTRDDIQERWLPVVLDHAGFSWYPKASKAQSLYSQCPDSQGIAPSWTKLLKHSNHCGEPPPVNHWRKARGHLRWWHCDSLSPSLLSLHLQPVPPTQRSTDSQLMFLHFF